MTQDRRGRGPSPEQLTDQGPEAIISVISQRRVTTTPVPGQVREQVAVTFRIAPSPPQVIFVRLELLPAWVFRRDNPGKDVSEELEVQNDQALRGVIRERAKPEGPSARQI